METHGAHLDLPVTHEDYQHHDLFHTDLDDRFKIHPEYTHTELAHHEPQYTHT